MICEARSSRYTFVATYQQPNVMPDIRQTVPLRLLCLDTKLDKALYVPDLLNFFLGHLLFPLSFYHYNTKFNTALEV